MVVVAQALTVGMRCWLTCKLLYRKHIEPYAQFLRSFPKSPYSKVPIHLAIHCGGAFEGTIDVHLVRSIVAAIPGIQFVSIVGAMGPSSHLENGLRVDVLGLDGCERLRSAIDRLNAQNTEVTVETLRALACPDVPPYDLMIVLADRLVIRGSMPLQIAFCEFFHQPAVIQSTMSCAWRLRAVVHASLRQYSRSRQNYGR